MNALTSEGWPIRREGDVLLIPALRDHRQEVVRVDLGDHPLRDLALDFLLSKAEGASGGTTEKRGRSLRLLGRFLNRHRHTDLTPKTFSAFIEFANGAENRQGERRFSEEVVGNTLSVVLMFYEHGIQRGRPGWSHTLHGRMKKRRRSGLRGATRRRTRQSIERATSTAAFEQLAAAVAIELEECRRVLAEHTDGRRGSWYTKGALDPNPFVVLALILVLRVGIRSEELNTLRLEDVERDPVHGQHRLYVHAPNKQDDFVAIDDAILEVIDFCLTWGEEARNASGSDFLLQYMAITPRRAPRVVTARNLNHRMLPRFYRKYFGVRVTRDGRERPLLHADNDPTQPFSTSYRKLRNAFAVQVTDREDSLSVAQGILRHRTAATTKRNYLQRDRVDLAKKTSVALTTEARVLAVSLKNPVAVGVDAHTIEEAARHGASDTPWGQCSAASCRRANHCLECDQLVVLSTRRARLSHDADHWGDRADALERTGDRRGAENLRRRATLAQAQIVRIDLAEGVER